MAPRQGTIGKFFGAATNGTNGSKKQPQQTTLASRSEKSTFSSKAKSKDEKAVQKKDAMDVDEEDEEDRVRREDARGGDSDAPSTSKRKSPESEAEMADEDEDEPVKKRPRRADKKAGAAAAVGAKAAKETPVPKKPVEEDEEVSVEEEKEEEEEDDSESENPSEEEEEAPPIKAAPAKKTAAPKKKKTQTTLVPPANQPDIYPDWKAGDPVPYAALCETFSKIELTTKRLIISDYCSRFLQQVLRLTPADLLPTVQLMINKLAADYQGIELGIGESLIMKAIGEATGRGLSTIKADHNQIGDLGLVAAKSRSNQPTMFKPKPLTVRTVLQNLMKIATASGTGSQQRKVDEIKKLLAASDVAQAGKAKVIDITKDKGGPSESKYIVRFLEGKLRLGLAEKTVLTSLAHAMVIHEAEQKEEKAPGPEKLAEGEAVLKAVYSELPNYEVIIPAMTEHGISHLRENCKLQPGVPLKPMLAKPTKSITEVLDRFEGKSFTCEYKYDGERAQIHYVATESPEQYAKENPATKYADGDKTMKKASTGISAIFSRNSEDLSKKYPDILEKLHTWIKPETKSFVLDCETVAWDVKEKKVLPFQQLMTRKRKDVKAEDVKVKVCVFAFDMLYHNGEKTLRERREVLHQAFNEVEGEFQFAQSGDTSDLDQIQNLLDESVKASCEGLMVKMLDTEESGYEPSKRSRNWLKVKKDYLSGVGDSLDLVVLGAYFGKGKRTSVYGAFLLACYNTADDTYETVCNIGTGFSDEILAELHGELSQSTIDKPKPFYIHSSVPKDQPDVWFEPRFVWEVKTADLTMSPRYKAGHDALGDAAGKGISLRFPRFIKKRDDKKPDQATGSRAVVEMYRKQESVTKQKGPSVDDDFEY